MTSDSQNEMAGARAQQMEAEAVDRYLREHPDFFVGRDDLLAGLTVPHESGQAISLLERQVSLLRERQEDASRRLNEFVDSARHNDTLFEKTRLIVLALLGAGTLAQLAETVAREVPAHFGAVRGSLLFIGDQDLGLNHRARDEARAILSELFDKQRTFCGDISAEQAAFLFPDSDKTIMSAAVVPIHLSSQADDTAPFPAAPLLVIGSTTPGHFNNAQDTLFVDFIGEVLSALIARMHP